MTGSGVSAWGLSARLAILIACASGAVRATADYPLTFTLDATADGTTASAAAVVTVRVDRLMEENRRKRVTDALTYSGYGNFLTALRALPAVGALEVQKRSVAIRYAREQPEGTGRRLLLVADRPLFFLSADPAKTRTGYELTVVDLHIDADGNVTGSMAGAARVKPSPDGPVLGDFAEHPVKLASRATRH